MGYQLYVMFIHVIVQGFDTHTFVSAEGSEICDK